MYLETEHLIIREPLPDDWRGALSFLADGDVMRWIHLGPDPFNDEQARQWIADLIFYNNLQPRDSYNCLIVERDTGQFIGWIGIGTPSPHRLAEGDLDFGYALARAHWGKGYMTEALGAVLRYAFMQLGSNSVFAICEVQNVGSSRVMEKVGMLRNRPFTEVDAATARSKDMVLYKLTKATYLTLPPR